MLVLACFGLFWLALAALAACAFRSIATQVSIDFGLCWLIFRSYGSILSILGALGALLGRSWELLERSWGLFSRFGAFLGRFSSIFGGFGMDLGWIFEDFAMF